MPCPHDLEGHHCRPFFCQQLAVRWHGAGADAADVGVVAAGGHEKHDLTVFEHRGDDRYVWQVAAACGGVGEGKG